MICPWCMHYGAEDDEYLFDEELYCGICAQSMPADEAGWIATFEAMTPEMLGYVEEELNRIALSKSGLRTELLTAMGEAIEAIAALRGTGTAHVMALPESTYARWVQFACTYFAPQLR